MEDDNNDEIENEQNEQDNQQNNGGKHNSQLGCIMGHGGTLKFWLNT
jgi:hypothetical protein